MSYCAWYGKNEGDRGSYDNNGAPTPVILLIPLILVKGMLSSWKATTPGGGAAAAAAACQLSPMITLIAAIAMVVQPLRPITTTPLRCRSQNRSSESFLCVPTSSLPHR